MESHLFQLFSKDGIENIRKYTFRNLEGCTKEEEEKNRRRNVFLHRYSI